MTRLLDLYHLCISAFIHRVYSTISRALTSIYPEKDRYKVIGVEMKGMESSMKLVALGATQRRG